MTYFLNSASAKNECLLNKVFVDKWLVIVPKAIRYPSIHILSSAIQTISGYQIN
jgi:hypothetical protein